MRKVIGYLLVILMTMCVGYNAISESAIDGNHYDEARGLANFMEDHYGVTILIGSECADIETNGFELGNTVTGRSPLRDALQIRDYQKEMELIDDAFSVYPPGFFRQFVSSEAPSGIRILLVDQIVYDGTTMAGTTTIQDGFYNVFLSVGAFNILNVYHEIWHAMEYRITCDHPDAFAEWNSLNPVDFQYTGEYLEQDIWEQAVPKDEWFVRGYSIVNEIEDRATVIEAVFQNDQDWWKDHPYIQKKLDALLAAAKPVFGDVFSGK